MGMTNIEIIHAMNREQQPLYCTKKEQNTAVDAAVEALEKQVPQNVITYAKTNRADCPVCGATVRGIDKNWGDWCSKCGQKLNWEN